MSSETTHRCWAEIDQSALRHNAAVVRERIGAGVELLAVVKANGYGHGMVGVAKALAQDAQLFGVANLEEAVTLRQELSQPIIVLGPALPEERTPIAEGGFIPSVSTLDEAQAFDRVMAGSPVPLNFVIDTGMGRMGIPRAEAIGRFPEGADAPGSKVLASPKHL